MGDASFSLSLIGGSTKCGRVMANYFAFLEITKKANVITDKKCLEVGAGTGIVGCTLAYLGAQRVIMTDQPGVTDIVRENAKQLNAYGGLFDAKVEVGELLWGEEEAKKYLERECEVLCGSDLIYAH